MSHRTDHLDDDMNDEDFAEDFADVEAELELDLEPERRPKVFTALQRIEMFREERWLKAMVEDFGDDEDFTLYENPPDLYSSEFSH